MQRHCHVVRLLITFQLFPFNLFGSNMRMRLFLQIQNCSTTSAPTNDPTLNPTNAPTAWPTDQSPMLSQPTQLLSVSQVHQRHLAFQQTPSAIKAHHALKAPLTVAQSAAMALVDFPATVRQSTTVVSLENRTWFCCITAVLLPKQYIAHAPKHTLLFQHQWDSMADIN
jgi:hypothetical protein